MATTTASPRSHPLAFLTPEEITTASAIVKALIAKTEPSLLSTLRFKSISLSEPPKALLLPYLAAEASGATQLPFVPRCLSVIWSALHERRVSESVISLDTGVEVHRESPRKGQHGANDRGELRRAGEKILNDPMVLVAVKELKLPKDVVVQADTWMFGTDRHCDENTHKMLQCLLYARAPSNHPDSNQYAYPLPISPRYDIFEEKVLQIDKLATGGKADGLRYDTAATNPAGPMAHCVPGEYHPDLLPPPRTDVKPLQVLQPEGASFTVTDGNLVQWQKWRFRVGFGFREGMTVHDVRYDGRPVFYRLSVSEMTVPYGGKSSPMEPIRSPHCVSVYLTSQILDLPPTANKPLTLVTPAPAPARTISTWAATVSALSTTSHPTSMTKPAPPPRPPT